MTAIALSSEILDVWLAAVERESGGPVGYSAPPPVSEVRVLPDGRPVPPELQTLWSWRTIPYRAPEMGPAASPMSMTEAVEASNATQRIRQELCLDLGWSAWSEDLFLWSQVDRIWLIVDLSELGPTSPVYVSGDADFTEPPGQIAESLGELFQHWTGLIECGAEYYDGWWTHRDTGYPEYPIHGPPV